MARGSRGSSRRGFFDDEKFISSGRFKRKKERRGEETAVVSLARPFRYVRILKYLRPTRASTSLRFGTREKPASTPFGFLCPPPKVFEWQPRLSKCLSNFHASKGVAFLVWERQHPARVNVCPNIAHLPRFSVGEAVTLSYHSFSRHVYRQRCKLED